MTKTTDKTFEGYTILTLDMNRDVPQLENYIENLSTINEQNISSLPQNMLLRLMSDEKVAFLTAIEGDEKTGKYIYRLLDDATNEAFFSFTIGENAALEFLTTPFIRRTSNKAERQLRYNQMVEMAEFIRNVSLFTFYAMDTCGGFEEAMKEIHQAS